MNVEMVFTGLCSILNPRNTNSTMGEPAVILVQTMRHPGEEANAERSSPEHSSEKTAASAATARGGAVTKRHSHGHGDDSSEDEPCGCGGETNEDEGEEQEIRIKTETCLHGQWPSGWRVVTEVRVQKGHQHPGEEAPVQQLPQQSSVDCTKVDHEHIPFIAFDTNAVSVHSNVLQFETYKPLPRFKFLRLEGWELAVDGHAPATPNVDVSYNRVVRKDDYWPEAANQWDRNYVPLPNAKPNKAFVPGFFRFGSGSISAGRVSQVPTKFTRLDGTTLTDNFAAEVRYTFAHRSDTVVIIVSDLADGTEVDQLTFSRVRDESPMTIFIGNLVEEDIDDALLRETPVQAGHGCHFTFLNAVAGLSALPPNPEPVQPPIGRNAPGPRIGGGGSGGVCGPGHANG